MIAAIALLVIAISWRLLGLSHRDDYSWVHNFAPLSAIALCGAFVLPRRYAFTLPLVALLVTDIALNLKWGFPVVSTQMIARYFVLAAISGAGWWLRRHPQVTVVLGTSALCSVLFYFVTNSVAWWVDPGYAKNFEGWSQALVGGLPGFPTTLVFFRNSLMSDVAFTALFLLCFRVSKPALAAPAEHQPEVARWI